MRDQYAQGKRTNRLTMLRYNPGFVSNQSIQYPAELLLIIYSLGVGLFRCLFEMLRLDNNTRGVQLRTDFVSFCQVNCLRFRKVGALAYFLHVFDLFLGSCTDKVKVAELLSYLIQYQVIQLKVRNQFIFIVKILLVLNKEQNKY